MGQAQGAIHHTLIYGSDVSSSHDPDLLNERLECRRL
jgi:hypothetical protein